jgi:hypothetical protein
MSSLRSELRRRIVMLSIAGCSFTPSSAARAPDATVVIPDGGPCEQASTECVSADVMRTCSGSGAMPGDTACDWGCVATGAAHCGVLVPAGGAVTSEDFGGTRDLTIMTSIDTGDGMGKLPKIDGAAWPDFRRVNGIAIYRFHSVHVVGAIAVGGELGVAIVADDVVTIDSMDTPMCGPADVVGGFAGGAPHMDALGSGAGIGGISDGLGGGGGGNGGVGGIGGGGAAGGSAFGASDLAVAQLVGGGAGGGGGGGGGGGRGGAAIQIVSNKSITIAGAINAGGCGGIGSMDHSGGGGGAGGTILLEAPQITIGGTLAVNGGGGGGGMGIVATRDGSRGTPDRSPAVGGIGNGVGGLGAAGATLDGSPGTMVTFSGGGGGAVGRIRLDTVHGVAAVTNATLSPALDDQPTTTCTQAPAAVQ